MKAEYPNSLVEGSPPKVADEPDWIMTVLVEHFSLGVTGFTIMSHMWYPEQAEIVSTAHTERKHEHNGYASSGRVVEVHCSS